MAPLATAVVTFRSSRGQGGAAAAAARSPRERARGGSAPRRALRRGGEGGRRGSWPCRRTSRGPWTWLSRAGASSSPVRVCVCVVGWVWLGGRYSRRVRTEGEVIMCGRDPGGGVVIGFVIGMRGRRRQQHTKYGIEHILRLCMVSKHVWSQSNCCWASRV